MSASPVIVWYRLDFRIDDHPALAEAAATGRPVVPVFVWAPHEEAPWPPGAASTWWLHRSLVGLSNSLEEIGGRLFVRDARNSSMEAVLEEVAKEANAEALFYHRRWEPALRDQEARVEQRLRRAGMEVRGFESGLLHAASEIATQQGTPFQVFTPFWKQYQKLGDLPAPVEGPNRLQATKAAIASASIDQLGLLPTIPWDEGLKESWAPGEAGARLAFDRFQRAAADDYALGRDRPDRVGTSRLSPHLHFGEISPRRVWHDLKRRREEGVASFLREIAWRDFSAHLLHHFPRTPTMPLRPAFEKFPWRRDEAALRAWQKGRTGYPIVDAGMRELWHTGWMHNRVRMIVASFLVKHLLNSWQDGARWFWDTLVDADLANNTMGWQWSAGCGADAAPYFRIFNPTLQGKKFDPEGAYVKRWVPELAKANARDIHEPRADAIVEHAFARKRALEAFELTKG